MRTYISSLIGAEYLRWNPGDQIIITSQTGSGKSTFVFNKLLKNAADHNKYLVYFCNRRSLENQMQRTTGVSPFRLADADVDITMYEQERLLIVTYQYCEKNMQFPNIAIWPNESDYSKEEQYKMRKLGCWNPRVFRKEEIMYYVFDEAHYFTSDSLFNANTNYWKPSILHQEGCISVFLTATPEPLFCYLAEARMREIAYENQIKQRGNTNTNEFGHEYRIVPNDGYEEQMLENEYMMETVLREAYNVCCMRSNERVALEEPINIGEYNYISSLLNIPHMKMNSIPLEFRSESEIRERLKKYNNQFEYGFLFIFDVLLGIPDRVGALFRTVKYLYSWDVDYSYIEPFYFENYEELFEEIIASDEKWLIFIDREKDGIILSDYLNVKNCNAVFVSAKRRNMIRCGAKKTFEEIANTSSFSCKVLIATSVLDCGISLKDPMLKNIVIAQPDKTEFIQMIGRRRVMEGEQIKLYIKAYSPKEINSLRASMESKLRFMMRYFVQSYTTEDKNKKRITNEVISGEFPMLLCTDTQNPNGYYISKTAYIQCLYALRVYSAAMLGYNGNRDLSFFIEAQLDWIGKGYDVRRWYKYDEKLGRLLDLIEATKKCEWLTTEEQAAFCEKCMECILDLPSVLLTKEMHDYGKRYQKCKQEGKVSIPRKVRLNKFFEKIDVPYRIESRQLSRNNRMTFWRIIDVEFTTEDNEQD